MTPNVSDWTSVLAGLGIGAEYLRNRHGPCPGCGGKDRFRFDDKDGRGTFVCSQGGGDVLAGDGFDLLQHIYGWGFKEAKAAVEQQMGVLPEIRRQPHRTPPKRAPEPSPTQPYAEEIWSRVEREDDVVAQAPYAIAKGIGWAAGAGRATVSGGWIGQNADCVVAPIRRRGVGDVVGVECLSGRKDTNGKYLRQTFGTKREGCLLLGCEIDPRAEWHMVEGWADGASVLRRERNIVAIVTFGMGHFDRVAGMVEKDHNPPTLERWRDAA